MIIAPSILSADFSNLEQSLKRVASTKWLHVDVMDGHFVPNISIGPLVVKGVRKLTSQVLDTHLMISNPKKYTKAFVDAGSDFITFHVEAVEDPIDVINHIKSFGIKAGISIKPNTNIDAIITLLPDVDQVLVMSVEPGFGGQAFIPTALDKIKQLHQLRQQHNYQYLISVDGGINQETGQRCKESGVDVLVAGSYIFNSDNPQEKIDGLR